MNGFVPLAGVLKSHFKKSFASLPTHIQARVTKDFAPWPWDKMTPDERRNRANLRDYENDPATREEREGLKALTDPDSPSYSEQETKRLRGDFLPEKPPPITRRNNLVPLTWVDQPTHQLVPTVQRSKMGAASLRLTGGTVAVSDAPEVVVPASSPVLSGTVTHTTKTPRRDILNPVIELAQSQCRNRLDTAEVWAQLGELAKNKTTPLFGATEDGLQYLDKGVAAIFKRDALDKRLHPEKRGKPGKRR